MKLLRPATSPASAYSVERDRSVAVQKLPVRVLSSGSFLSSTCGALDRKSSLRRRRSSKVSNCFCVSRVGLVRKHRRRSTQDSNPVKIMGSGATRLLSRREPEIQFMESTKAPTAKDQDTRKRNSLMFYMRDWQGLTTFEQQEASMMQIKRYHQMEAKIETDDPVMGKLNKAPLAISLGDMRLLRDTVIMRWKDINRSYQGPLLGDTVLHRVCREGYLDALKFMLDPNTKSIFETEVVDPSIVNKRKRTALMLCFTSPHLTMVAKEYGLEKDSETGLAVPRAKRPQTAQTDKDWMKPGSRADREEMIRILVQDLGASVTTLDMHEYRHVSTSPTQQRDVCVLGENFELVFMNDVRKGGDIVPRTWRIRVVCALQRRALFEHAKDLHLPIEFLQACMTGETALHFAVSLRHGEAAEVLLKRCPALVNEGDKDGDRAIHLAVNNSDSEIVKLLIDNGADINSPNFRKTTPLAVACNLQDWQMVNLLLDLKINREEEAFSLLTGEAEEKIRWRLRREEEERLKLARAIGAQEADEARLLEMAAYGQWVPYTDKMGGGIFYYNKVSRESRRERPEDYVKDREYVMTSATFGMHFYH